MSETKKTRAFCRKLEAYGAFTYPLIASAWSPAGWPDRLIGVSGFFCLVEFKDTTTRVKPAQRALIRRMLMRRLPVIICRFEETGFSFEDYDGKVLAVEEELSPKVWVRSLKKVFRTRGLL